MYDFRSFEHLDGGGEEEEPQKEIALEEGQYWKPKEKNVEYARAEYKILKIKDDTVYFGEISAFFEDALLLDTKDFLKGFERTLLPEKRIATHNGKWHQKQTVSWTGHAVAAHWSCCGQKTYNSICAKFLEQ